jgi:hypothetical protein
MKALTAADSAQKASVINTWHKSASVYGLPHTFSVQLFFDASAFTEFCFGGLNAFSAAVVLPRANKPFRCPAGIHCYVKFYITPYMGRGTYKELFPFPMNKSKGRGCVAHFALTVDSVESAIELLSDKGLSVLRGPFGLISKDSGACEECVVF